MKFLLLAIFMSVMLFADMKIYTSKDCQINSITLEELQKIYLKKTKFLQKNRIVVYDNSQSYAKFYTNVIGKSESQIHAYWMKQIFSGKRLPPKKIKPDEILSLLNNNKSAIVYSEEDLDAKVIYEHK